LVQDYWNKDWLEPKEPNIGWPRRDKLFWTKDLLVDCNGLGDLKKFSQRRNPGQPRRVWAGNEAIFLPNYPNFGFTSPDSYSEGYSIGTF